LPQWIIAALAGASTIYFQLLIYKRTLR
jgi:hypothetical protein